MPVLKQKYKRNFSPADGSVLALAAQHYAKRDGEAASAEVRLLHYAKGFLAYEIEVYDGEGLWLTTDTVGHVSLIQAYKFQCGIDSSATATKQAVEVNSECIDALLPQDRPQINALGTRLREARERRQISAELMAERLDVPLEMLQSLEAGDASLSIALLFGVLRLLQLDADIDTLARDTELKAKLLSIWGQR